MGSYLKRCFAILFLFQTFAAFVPAHAQFYFYNDRYYDNPWIFELGGSVNAMNCLTDLGGYKGLGTHFLKDLNLGKTQLAGGVFMDLLYKYAVALRAEYTFGHVKANDDVLYGATNIAKERYNRNLNFQSIIQEGSLMLELHPLFMFIDWPAKDYPPPNWSPYLLAGVGYFHFNPKTLLNGIWVDLQPLSTEGEGFIEYPARKVYKLNQLNIPFGLGVKYEVNPTINLRLEAVGRHLFTDYLDDVSTTYIDPNLFYKYFTGVKLQEALALNDRRLEPRNSTRRGIPKYKDSYFTVCFKLTFVMGRDRQY